MFSFLHRWAGPVRALRPSQQLSDRGIFVPFKEMLALCRAEEQLERLVQRGFRHAAPGALVEAQRIVERTLGGIAAVPESFERRDTVHRWMEALGVALTHPAIPPETQVARLQARPISAKGIGHG